MKKVKKAVIPAAGLGTRFLPVTKAIPKEMLPIVDVPTIQLIVEEAVQSGIEEIILITAHHKEAIENHFKNNFELEAFLDQKGKKDLADLSRSLTKLCRITPVHQTEALGLGHAVLCAEQAIGHEPFAVLLGDDLIDATPACTKQLIEVFYEKNTSVVGVMEVPESEVCKYGMIQPHLERNELQTRLTRVKDLVEKPKVGTSPSLLAIPGRYILSSDIFSALKETEQAYLRQKTGEIQLTDALRRIASLQGLYAYQFEGKRFDAGDRLGYLEANIAYALKRPELRKPLKEVLEKYARS